MVPNSGAESDTDTYSAPVFCENRFQPAPSSKPFLRLTTRKSGSLSFALRALGMIEIGAVTFSVASVPSMVPSDFAVRAEERRVGKEGVSTCRFWGLLVY